MIYRREGQFVNRTFRITEAADRALNTLSRVLNVSKSQLVEEAIELMAEKRMKEIAAGNRQLSDDVAELLGKYSSR